VRRRLGRRGAATLVAASLAWFGAAPASAPMHDIGSFSGFDHIRTSGGIDYNLTTGTFTIPQRFDASRNGTDISADRADGNSKQRMLHASGGVVVHQNTGVSGHGAQADPYTQKPSTLTCDKLDIDGGRKLYTATGNVHFAQSGGRQASSDAATLNDVTNQLHMEGHVHIKDGEQTLDGDIVDYNTVTGQVHASGAPLLTTVPLDTPGPIAPAASRPKSKKHR